MKNLSQTILTLSLMIVGLTLIALTFIGCSSPPQDVNRAELLEANSNDVATQNTASDSIEQEIAIDKASSSFTFTGYGPGKSHTGTFTDMTGSLYIDNKGKIIGASGIINTSSVKTESTGLDGHLKNKDFFDVEKYPTIEMVSTSISDGVLTGTLLFHGVSKELSFPVTVTEFGITADTIIKMSDFGIVYTGVNDEVRIQFDLKASK